MTTLQFCNALIREGNAQGSFMHSMTAQKTKQGYNLLNSMGNIICNVRYRGKIANYYCIMQSLFAIRFVQGNIVSITESRAEIEYFCRVRAFQFKS